VLLLLSLVVLRYVEANLPPWLRVLVRNGVPVAAILLATAFFLSILSPFATQPDGLIVLTPIGAVMAVTLFVLGTGRL
jgi:hypothetical protein